MMRALRQIHAVVGLALCLLLALIALTGAAMVFEPQLRGGGATAAMSPAALAEAMRTAEARFGAPQIRAVVFASALADRHEVQLRTGDRAWIDPSGGKVVPFDATDRAFETLFDLHHQLLAGATGETVVGCIGLAGVLMAVSGLVIWWPARRSFRAAVVPGRRGRAGWLAAHRDLAVMVGPMVALTMFTGAGMALSEPFRVAFAAPAPKGPPLAAAEAAAGSTDWARAAAAAQARFPGAQIRMALPPAKRGLPAAIRLRQPQEWHGNGRTFVYVAPGGRIVGVYDAQAQGASARAYNSFWPLHTGRSVGLAWQAVVFIGGLGLAALSLYGGEAYRRKLFRRRGAASRIAGPRPAE